MGVPMPEGEVQSDLGATFLTHRIPLRRAVLSIVGKPEQADDVMQDAYVKLIGAATAMVIKQPLGYCFQVVRNMALDHCRRSSLEAGLFAQEEEGHHVPAALGAPERKAINRQNLAIVDQALGTLPERTRKVFEMYHVSGLTQRDIGQNLGVSIGLVNGMIREATNALMGCRHLLATE